MNKRPFRLLAICLPIALAACSPRGEQTEPVRPARVMRAVPASMPGVAAYAGEIRARYEADLSFRVSGKLLSRTAELGARVKSGQVLARLDPQDANLNAVAARSALASAESDLAFARAELKRAQELRDKNFVAQGVLEQRENAFKAAQARHDAAAAQASVAGNQAGYTALIADADGVVTAVTADPGQVVAAGQPILRVARVGEKDAVIHVAENHLAALRTQPAAKIALWAVPGRLYNGKVREIAAAADALTRTYTVKVAIGDADEELRWGMSAQVGFPAPSPRASSPPASFLLPSSALTQTDDRSGAKPAVWLVGADGRVALRPVTVARYTESGVQLEGGLSGGELVVIAGAHKLVAGQIVKPVEEALPPVTPVAAPSGPGGDPILHASPPAGAR